MTVHWERARLGREAVEVIGAPKGMADLVRIGIG